MRVAICVDMSGSVPEACLRSVVKFLEEAKKLIDGYVVCFTTQIEMKCNLADLEPTSILQVSRGGTDYKCLSFHTKDNFAIIISDGMGQPSEFDMVDRNLMLVNPVSIADPKRLAICVSLLQDTILGLDH